MRTARYRAVPSKIDRRRSIEEEKGKKKRKRKKKEEGKKEYLARAPSSLACRHRPRVACASSLPAAAFSPARGDGVSPRAGRHIEATGRGRPAGGDGTQASKDDARATTAGKRGRHASEDAARATTAGE
ncbi:hypothetical protein GW17_00031928 [Ensete ventricosum]|nr:hypothetical protein GW17_00031928 [Ensete ventricosum]